MRVRAFTSDGKTMSELKTAIVHDWLTSKGGAEKFLEALYQLFPARVHVLLKDKKLIETSFWHDKKIETSFLQYMPFAKKIYRHYLPLFPIAIEQFNLANYDLILSSSHAVAKNVITHAGQLHICYCHTPMRYAWDLYHQYMKELGCIKKTLAAAVLHYMRMWDSAGTSRVDHFIANSHYVARRIKKVYGRESTVIYSGIPLHLFSLASAKEDFYLTVSRMVPYKRIDLIVRAFSQMRDKKLVVIGDGPEMERVKKYATSNIELLGGELSDEEVRSYMGRARAFIFAAEEDFGLVPVEAQACGTPVIAFGRGGVVETVKEGITGVFFDEQTVPSLHNAILEFEKNRDAFDPLTIRQHAELFSDVRFQKEFKNFIDSKLSEFYESRYPSRR